MTQGKKKREITTVQALAGVHSNSTTLSAGHGGVVVAVVTAHKGI